MAFTPKDWKDWPDLTTPLTAAALVDEETRVTDYADTLHAGQVTTGLASARPTAATAGNGAVYIASDTSEVSRSNGSAWTTLGALPGALAVTGSERPLYFDFTDTTTFARGWTVVTGAAPTVSGGKMTPSATAEAVLVRASEAVADSEFVVKLTAPSGAITAAKAVIGFVGRYVDASNFLLLQFNSSGQIQTYIKSGGTFSILGSHVTISPAPVSSGVYWLRGLFIRNTITIEWWTTDPAAGGSPQQSNTYTLTTPQAATFGNGMRGKVGFRTDAVAGEWGTDDLIIRPRAELSDSAVTGSERPLYFDFTDTTTFARGWTVAAGIAPTVSGGTASPASIAEHLVVRSAEAPGDVQITYKIQTGATLAASSWFGLVAKYLDSSNYLQATVTNSDGTVRFYKKDGGTFTQLGSSGAASFGTSGTYWLRFTVIGNDMTCEWFLTDPAGNGAAAQRITHTLTGGNATKFGAGIRGKPGFRWDAKDANIQQFDDLVILPLGRPPRQRDVQVFTSSATWTKPAGAAADPRATVEAHVVAGGSGGASGARRASGTATSGGAGGHSGPYTVVTALASQVAASCSVTVGAGGAGAAGITTNDTNGLNGGVGGASLLNSFFTDGRSVQARTAGTSAAGGGSTGASGGGTGGVGTHTPGGGGSGVVGGAGGNATMVTGNVTGAGGAGGGVSSAPAGQTGGSGAFSAISNQVSGTVAAGATGATAPPGMAVFPGGPTLGFGAGGGGGSHTGAGGNGAAGSNYGGGGGGGGSCLNGNTSGAGGAGAPGVVVIITEWGG